MQCSAHVSVSGLPESLAVHSLCLTDFTSGLVLQVWSHISLRSQLAQGWRAWRTPPSTQRPRHPSRPPWASTSSKGKPWSPSYKRTRTTLERMRGPTPTLGMMSSPTPSERATLSVPTTSMATGGWVLPSSLLPPLHKLIPGDVPSAQVFPNHGFEPSRGLVAQHLVTATPVHNGQICHWRSSAHASLFYHSATFLSCLLR